MSGLFNTSTLAQVGFIVRDLEATRKSFAQLLGVPEPPICDGGEFEVTGTTVYGQAAPRANCRMAFFDVGPNIQIELIEPNGEHSVWQEFLDEHGEGMHHLAFQTRNTDEKIAALKAQGIECIQRGKYGDGGGQYAYFDARDTLKCFLESLESFDK